LTPRTFRAQCGSRISLGTYSFFVVYLRIHVTVRSTRHFRFMMVRMLGPQPVRIQARLDCDQEQRITHWQTWQVHQYGGQFLFSIRGDALRLVARNARESLFPLIPWPPSFRHVMNSPRAPFSSKPTTNKPHVSDANSMMHRIYPSSGESQMADVRRDHSWGIDMHELFLKVASDIIHERLVLMFANADRSIHMVSIW
jgi:hypothetical protein